MLNTIGFVWTLPNTMLGVLLGALAFQRPRLHGGALIFDRRARGVSKILVGMNRTAMTVGYIILSAVPVEGTLLRHEQHHIEQYKRWGPFFIPVYGLLAILYGYRRHPFEIAAMRAAGELA
jgi:hypothetical protein